MPDPDAAEPLAGTAAALRLALEFFVETIDTTGGLMIANPANPVAAPVGDPTWTDLACAYIRACDALGLNPMYRDAVPGGPGYYTMAVYCHDCDDLQQTAGSWDGWAESRAAANAAALAKFMDSQVDGWWVEMLDFDPNPDEAEDQADAN